MCLTTAGSHCPQANWSGLLFAIKGVGGRYFCRRLSSNYRDIFPNLPSRTRLFRRLKTRRAWMERFLAEPSVMGVIDAYDIELIHPVREGRSESQTGKKGLSNHRWPITGGQSQVANHRWWEASAASCWTMWGG